MKDVSPTTLIGIGKLIVLVLGFVGFMFGKFTLQEAIAGIMLFGGVLSGAGFILAKDANAPDARTVTETRRKGDVVETVTTSEVSEETK